MPVEKRCHFKTRCEYIRAADGLKIAALLYNKVQVVGNFMLSNPNRTSTHWWAEPVQKCDWNTILSQMQLILICIYALATNNLHGACFNRKVRHDDGVDGLQ